MLDVLALDYVRTARAKGMSERAVVTRHALKNALLSVVTVLGLQLGGLLGGSIVIEQVFGWPGIGRLSLAAIQQRDYGVVQGVVLFVATAFVLVNFAVDSSMSASTRASVTVPRADGGAMTTGDCSRTARWRWHRAAGSSRCSRWSRPGRAVPARRDPPRQPPAPARPLLAGYGRSRP